MHQARPRSTRAWSMHHAIQNNRMLKVITTYIGCIIMLSYAASGVILHRCVRDHCIIIVSWGRLLTFDTERSILWCSCPPVSGTGLWMIKYHLHTCRPTCNWEAASRSECRNRAVSCLGLWDMAVTNRYDTKGDVAGEAVIWSWACSCPGLSILGLSMQCLSMCLLHNLISRLSCVKILDSNLSWF